MTTDPTRPYLEHAPRCQRTRPPVLIAAWHRTDAPLFQCPSCGATVVPPVTLPAPHRTPRPQSGGGSVRSGCITREYEASYSGVESGPLPRGNVLSPQTH